MVRVEVEVVPNVLRFLRDIAELCGRTPQALIEEDVENLADTIVDDLPSQIFNHETIRRKYNLRTRADC